VFRAEHLFGGNKNIMSYNSAYTGDEMSQRLSAIKSGGGKDQVLTKLSNTDYDTGWVTQAGKFENATPVAGANVPNNSVYIESVNNRLSFKDSTGTIFRIQLEGFIAPTVQWEDGSSVQWEDGTDVEWD